MDVFDEMSVPMEPGVLLEESWFFGNLLDRKSRMLRCYSDPCPSYKNSNQEFSGGKSMEETFSSLQKLPQEEKLNLDSRRSNPRLQRASSSTTASSQRCNLQRAPSLPVYVEPHDEESDFSMGKLIRQASINHVKIPPPKHTSQGNLQRVPSLPVYQESEQIHDVESDFSMGKLIRQASINQVKITPPKHTSKVNLLKQSQRSSLQRAPSLPVYQESEQIDDIESEFSMGKLIRQASINQVKIPPPKHTSKVNLLKKSPRRSLQRAPSLPAYQESEQIDDAESDFSMGKLIRQASVNHVKVSPQKHTSQGNLQRELSLPVFQESEQIDDVESDFSMGKLISQASMNHVKISPQKQTSQVNLLKTSQGNLQRAPSLPVFAKKQEIHDEEKEFSMGKLIRQASLNHARVLPPKHTSKGLTRSTSISSITKHHLRRKQDQESKTRNSSNGLEVEDLQSFNNLDSNNQEKDSIPKFANTSTPSKKKPVGLSELDKIKRPTYSPEDHMKEQIKFWARAVASNVR